jgi:hypothetical protein
VSTFINRKEDAGRCPVCRFEIGKGDETRADGSAWKHERCAQDLDDGHIIEWRTIESVERSVWEEREEQLPRTGICDDHGRPS